MSDARSKVPLTPSSASSLMKARGKGGSGSGAETLRSIWLAVGRGGNTAQQQLQGFDDQIILMGRGELNGIGPGDRDSTSVRIEFLLPIRFQSLFERTPLLVVLPDADAGEAARQIGLAHRALTSEGFSLVLRPQTGSCRHDIRFYWLAIGTPRQPPGTPHSKLLRLPIAPSLNAQIPGLHAPEAPIYPIQDSTMWPDEPDETAKDLGWPDRRWWIRGITAFAALLPPLSLRRLRLGARQRVLKTSGAGQAGRA